MNPRRVLQQASVQARLRARIGAMPDVYRWREFVQSRDLEAVIEKMATAGLGFWVSGLARRPGSDEIERHCQQRLSVMIGFLGRLLPQEWRRVAIRLEQLPVVLRIGQPFKATGLQAIPPMDEHGSILSTEVGTISLEPDQSAMPESPTQHHLSRQQRLESLWLPQFFSSLPPLSQPEQAMVMRLIRLLRAHQRQQKVLETTIQEGGNVPLQGNWGLRQELFEQLRLMFAGDPFRMVLVLVYGLMELIQLERLRGVLLMHCFGWSNQDLSGGVA